MGDMGMGAIHGRGAIMSDILPWYGTGETIGILVDCEAGCVYFFKEDALVWYIYDQEIKNNAVKVFGCTDDEEDAIIYKRFLWNQKREMKLQMQIQKLKARVEAFHITETKEDDVW